MRGGALRMRNCITPQAMRAMEQSYFQKTGVASIALMERAASELTGEILRRLGDGRTLLAACGTGGNGGDGLACARMYAMAGGSARAVLLSQPATADCMENLRRARQAGVEILSPDQLENAASPGIWVDALFGTGLSRAPQGAAAEIIRRINRDRRLGSRVFAADIPSGLDGLSGKAFEDCVCADVTVSFQFCKTGLVLQDGLDVCGEVAARDLGIREEFFPRNMPALLEGEDIPRFFPPRKRNTHKGVYGHVLIVAGSLGMAGAAAMCAMAAMRAGAGLTTIACPASVAPVLQTLAPCAMCLPMPERNGALSPESAEEISRALSGKSAAVVGCGLSRRAAPEAVAAVLQSGIPAVVDADALNLLAENPALRKMLRPCHVVTPHPGEAARLLGRDMADPLSDAAALANLGAVALLKGACSVVCAPGGGVYLSASGCAGMAKGGSGDALSGILGALLAESRGKTPALTAALASEVHGRAGEAAQAKLGCRGMTPMDLIDALPGVFPC